MRLTNYFIKKKVQSLASGAAGRKHEFCALEDADHILVLYQANDRELGGRASAGGAGRGGAAGGGGARWCRPVSM